MATKVVRGISEANELDDQFVVADLGDIAAASSDGADEQLAKVSCVVGVGMGSTPGYWLAELADLLGLSI